MENPDQTPIPLPSDDNVKFGKYKTKFNPDRPIEIENDDKLERKDFARHMANALCNWIGDESFVVALNGPWGSGKTSVINLTEEFIKGEEENKRPTIIHFNPWTFSEDGDIQKHFFDQIANELELNNESKGDAKIAKELRLFESKLSFVPSLSQAKDIWTNIIIYSGLSVLSGNQLLSDSNSHQFGWNLFLSFAALVISILGIIRVLISKVADYKEKKIEYHKKSLSEIKKVLEKELRAREKKLLIIIDDIDRLDKKEIRQLFKLVRINANFPNTIYLLVFDREIVEKSLDEEYGVSGKDYLSKIVQVNFDLPHVSSSIIVQYLREELSELIHKFPTRAQKQIDKERNRWQVINESLIMGFFKNIRDVKRFINGLEFNISKLQQGGVMEVNPIDFVAIEAIRIFSPELFSYLKNHKEILTHEKKLNPFRDEQKDEKEINETLSPIIPNNDLNIKTLVGYLFPPIRGFLSTHHWHEDDWGNNLRVCAVDYFDCYFTLIPGGNNEEISQYVLENILSHSSSLTDFESILRSYMTNNKIGSLLRRIFDRAIAEDHLLASNKLNVIIALLNISDEVPRSKLYHLSFELHIFIVDIIESILNINAGSLENYAILVQAVDSSSALIGPITTISRMLSPKRAQHILGYNISEMEEKELKHLGVSKISKFDQNKLFKHTYVLYILYIWREWSDVVSLEGFITYVTEDNSRYLLFLSRFLNFPLAGDYEITWKNLAHEFDLDTMKNYLDPEEVKSKLVDFRNDSTFYEENQQIIDLVLEAIRIGG